MHEFRLEFVVSKCREHILKAVFNLFYRLVDCYLLMLQCSFLVLFLQDKFPSAQFTISYAICILILTKCQHFGHW